ncbi:hypothetical protein [Halorientalis salina]|uniref:hypothetical protein n=1 Tax=Halorientalis salina TaxID=2932266 RepID=UPI0010AD7C02|nr:hypothetical protein [Halorientalis salina]
MRRKLYLIAGLVLAVSSFPTLVLIPDLSLLDQVGSALTGLGGLLFVAAALSDRSVLDSSSVEWFHLAGAGDIAIGLGLPTSLAATSDDIVLVGAASLAGLVLVIIGMDMLRGGEYVDVSGR